MTNKVKARSILPWIKVQQLHIGTKHIIEIMRRDKHYPFQMNVIICRKDLEI